MVCPHCGAEAGAAVCGACGRPIPRFYEEAPRDLAFAAADGTVEADAGFDRAAAEDSFRKVARDLAEGRLDLDAYAERLQGIEAFLNSLLAEHEVALDAARRGLSQVPGFGDYEAATVDLLGRVATLFGEALTELAGLPEDGLEEHVDRAAAAAGEAMDALAELDRRTDDLEARLRP